MMRLLRMRFRRCNTSSGGGCVQCSSRLLEGGSRADTVGHVAGVVELVGDSITSDRGDDKDTVMSIEPEEG